MCCIRMQHCPVLAHAEGLIHILTCCYIWDNYFSKLVLGPCPVFLSPGIDFWGLVSIIWHPHWLGLWFSKCCPRPIHQQHLESCKEWNLLAPRVFTRPPGDSDTDRLWRTNEHRTNQCSLPRQHI